MEKETLIHSIENMVQDLIGTHPEHFLVDVRIKPTNNVKVFLDSDKGIILSDLISYNRKLHKMLEESPLFPDGDFSLEVSSPGLDEPLKNRRQYTKNVGRYVDLLLQDGSHKEGKLIEVKDEGLTIETESGKGKKKEIRQEEVAFDQIKQTKIQVKF